MRLVPTKHILKVTVVALLLILLSSLLLTCTAACNNKIGQADATSGFVSKNKQQTHSQPNNLTHGKSLKTGDYVQLGSYQVEDEGYNLQYCG